MLGSTSERENLDDKTLTDHSSQRGNVLAIQPLPNTREAKIDVSSGVDWNNQDDVCDFSNDSQMINMLQMPTHGITKTKIKNKINNINNPE